MIKTQIQLEEGQHEELKRLGHEQSRSLADLIRESVSLLVERGGGGRLPPLASVAGKYRADGAGGELKDHDRGWAEAIR